MTTRPGKGRPIIFLAAVVGLWVTARVAMWQGGDDAPEVTLALLAASGKTIPIPEQAGSIPAKSEFAKPAAGATLVEGLEPLPSAHAQSRYLEEPLAAGHDTLWMAASQDLPALESASDGM